ncbi:hypothetical protein MNBD_GAMMA23-2397 [hydrothermal vent metagenome]|uniref:Uncharacterized protein n=1 Tax=hydrothermal vent metagenome TaxID=652676 RepID=A0A3B1AFQ1_9ZZZZ
MVTRIQDMPVYAARTDQIEASLYNLWRRARLHLTFPMRIELPQLKQMALILEDDSWVLVDQCQFDLPIIAWLDFQDVGRNSLHTPVSCKMNYYHHLANRIHDKVLLLMTHELEQRLYDSGTAGNKSD